MSKSSIALLLSIAIALSIAGCRSSTSPSSSGSTTRPGVGSVFVYHIQDYDTLGRAVPYDYYDTLTVISSGISYQGKTNVVAFRSHSTAYDSMFIYISYSNYESNGDVSDYIKGTGAGDKDGWQTCPIATHGSTSFTTNDTTYVSNGQTINDFNNDIQTYTGQQTVTEAGQSFTTSVISTHNQSGTGTSSDTTSDWFAPSIGVDARSVTTYANVPPLAREEEHLVSYTLK